MELKLLGPFEVVEGGTVLALGGPGQRAVLAGLVLRANEVVPTGSIMQAVWGDDAPESAVGIIRTYVWRLRRALAERPGVSLTSRAPGYVLTVDREMVDAFRFERLAGEARRDLDAGRAPAAVAALDEALALWRGDVLSDLELLDWVRPAALRLEEMRLVAIEDRFDANLAVGRHADLIGDLDALTRQHPYRERLWGQLIVALYRSGRQADALAAYQLVRATLVEELGVEPGPRLQALERDVLAQAGDLDWRGAEGPGAPGPREQAAPVPVAVPIPLPGAVRRLAPDRALVGRSREIATVARCLDEALTGRFGAVFIAGPPGIGKTALATRAARDAHDTGAAVLLGRADENVGVPFQALREAIGHWAAHAGDAEIAGLDDHTFGQLLRIAPSLAGRRAVAAASSEPGDNIDRQSLFEAIVRWVEVVAAGRPTVVLLDDIQWADTASLLALGHLVRHPPAAGAVLVATHRDTETGDDDGLARLLASTRGEAHVHHVQLGGLSGDEVADLVRDETGAVPGAADAAFVPQLTRVTGGNPLFVVEMLRHLLEQGAIAPDRRRWTTQPLDAGVPSAVVELIRQRLSRLPAPSAAILQPASVLGEDFELTVLSRLAEMSELAVIEALEPAVAAQLVAHSGPRGDRFAFSHSLVRHAILDGLSLSHRTRLHWQAGGAIAAAAATHAEPRLGEIAYHLAAGVHAGDPHEAMAANVEAGRQALAVLGFEDACRRFKTATDLLVTTGVDDDALAFRAWLGLGQASAGMDTEAARQRDSYLQAAAIARARSWPKALALAAMGFAAYSTGDGPGKRDQARALALIDEALAGLAGEPPGVEQCMLLAMRTVHAVAGEDIYLARELTGRVESVAASLDDQRAGAAADVARCWNLLGTPRPHELEAAVERAKPFIDVPGPREFVRPFLRPVTMVAALQLADRARFEALRDELRARPEMRVSPNAVAHIEMASATIALCEGRFDDVDRLAAAARSDEWPVWTAIAEYHLALAAIERGLLAAVRPLFEQDLILRPHSVTSPACLALVSAMEGDAGEAARHVALVRGRRPFDALGWGAPLALRQLAEVAARLGDAALAAELLPVLADYSGQLLVSCTGLSVDGAADRAIGQLLATLGRRDEAIEKLAAAHVLEESFEAAALAARSRYWHARALVQRGTREDHRAARALVASVSSEAHRLGMTALAQEADALAATLPPGAKQASGATGQDG